MRQSQNMLLNMRQVCERTTLSRAAINKHRSNNNFPKPVRISDLRIAFLADEIDAWIEARIAKREVA